MALLSPVLGVPITRFLAITNKIPAVLNIIESYFLHQTEVDIKAMGHACKTVIRTNIYFPPITTLDCKNLLKNNWMHKCKMFSLLGHMIAVY